MEGNARRLADSSPNALNPQPTTATRKVSARQIEPPRQASPATGRPGSLRQPVDNDLAAQFFGTQLTLQTLSFAWRHPRCLPPTTIPHSAQASAEQSAAIIAAVI